jgi:protein O-GlcNAc transferase
MRQMPRKPIQSAESGRSAGTDADAARAFNAANAAARQGDWQTAKTDCDRALAIDPTLTVALLLRARALRHLGQIEQALAEYRGVLLAVPAEFTAALEGGNLALRLQDEAGAIDLFTRAVAARPDDPRGHLSLAKVLDGAESNLARDRGARHYHLALQVSENPNAPPVMRARDIHHLIGVTRLARGDAASALEPLRLAAQSIDMSGAISNQDAEILLDYGDALMRIGLIEDAARTWEIAARSTAWPVLKRLTDFLYRCNRWQDALNVLKRAQALHPNDRAIALAHCEMLVDAWQLDTAMEVLGQLAAQSEAEEISHLALKARISGKLGDVDAANAIYETLIAKGQDAFCSSLAMSMLYSSNYRPAQIMARQRAMFKNWGPTHRLAATPSPTARIGFVTSDLHHQHPVNIFLQPMLAHWDHSRHPLTIYNTGKSFDSQTSLAKSRVGLWHDLDYSHLAERVASDKTNVLIDLAGHTSVQSMAVFAKRAAPVQVSFLGYPGSTGVPNMDWLVGDSGVTPPEHDAFYSERVLRLPQTVFCYSPEEDYPLPDFGKMAQRPLTFGCFNNIPKLTPATLALWAQILHALPHAQLLLKAPSFSSQAAVNRLRGLFDALGIAASRLIFKGPSALAQMMADYSEVDIALDPMPYNGGTTTLQALWMGVPVVVRRGDYFVSRMGASFMQAAGLDDWIAENDRQYVQIAIAKARDLDTLRSLKSGLRAQLKARQSFDIRTYAQNFQDGIDRIWQGYCAENSKELGQGGFFGGDRPS